MTDTETTDHTEISDDKIVGKAFQWSLVIVAVVIGVAAAIFLLNREPQILTDVNEETPELATERSIPPLTLPQISFTDITELAGIDFRHVNGATGRKLLPETMGGGGAFFDFDNDGDQDLLCVNSTHWPDSAVNDQPTSALYANDGSGKFTNVTAGSGFDVSLYANGVACGDYDGDGLTDVYLTAVGSNRLFRNLGSGKFADVTEETGTAGDATDWSTGCGFFDFDNDGDLDLFVCNYLEWSAERDASMDFTLDGSRRAYGRPADFRGTYPVLFRNDGQKFTNISEAAGLHISNPDTQEPLAKSLGLAFADVNSDSYLDVIIANDTVQNLLFINQQDGTFVECADICGVAFDNSGAARGAMGVDAGFFRNNDALGVTIGNFANEMTALYVNQLPGPGEPIFRDEAVSNGIGPVTRIQLTFGILLGDFDLDGRTDILSCNGHLEADINLVQESQQYRQPPQLLWNCGLDYDTEFIALRPENLSPDFVAPMVGRGAARADIDSDGDLDIILFATGDTPRLLRNDQATQHHWLKIDVRNTANQPAIGATVKLVLNQDTTLTRTVMPTCSYQSQSSPILHFGLGQTTKITDAELTWSNGESQTINIDQVDQLIRIER